MEKYDAETQMSIFEQACQTPDCAEFIEECILVGCDVNKVISKVFQKKVFQHYSDTRFKRDPFFFLF